MVRIPTRLEELMPAAALEKVMDLLHQPDLSGTVREALGKIGLKDSNPLGQVQEAWQQARAWLDSLSSAVAGKSAKDTILNCTGQLFSPKISGVPVATSVAYAYARSANAFHAKQPTESKLESVVHEIFGNYESAWFSSVYAALQLMQSANPEAARIAISRADLIRIPGFGDVRSMMISDGQHLVEVGAANGSSADDWGQAGLRQGQIVLLVSPNVLTANAADCQRAAAIEAAKRSNATVVELIVDGVLSQGLATTMGFPDLRQRLESGADCIIVPTNFLLAGPPAVLVLGRGDWIAQLGKRAQNCGVALDPALMVSAARAIQLAGLADEIESGVGSQLQTNIENLKNRAKRLAIQLNDTQHISKATEQERSVALGLPPWDRYVLKNWAVRIEPKHGLSGLQAVLSTAGLEFCTTDGIEAVDLDLRFVPAERDHEIVAALCSESISPGAEGTRSSVDSNS